MIHYERNNIKRNLYHLTTKTSTLSHLLHLGQNHFETDISSNGNGRTSHMPSFETSITKEHSGSPYKLPTQHMKKFNMNNYWWWVNLAINIGKMTWCTIPHMLFPCLTISAFQQQHITFCFATNVPQGKYVIDTPIG